MTAEVFFGDAGRAQLTQRSQALWKLVRNDPRYAYYGRTVAHSYPPEQPVEWLASLARVQGASVAYFVPKELMADYGARLSDMGFGTDRHEHFLGRAGAYEAARAFLDETPFPADINAVRLDASSPEGLIRTVAELQASCEVMPVPASVMRGVSVPGLCLAALDGQGQVVAAAASFQPHHKDNPNAGIAFWGMIATRPDRRGERIAARLGAMAITHMWETQGARGFMTGVRADNLSSQKLCNRLGVTDSPYCYLTATDPAVMGAKVTK